MGVVVVAVELGTVARELLDGKNFATPATVVPARNLARDARVSVSVFDLENPYRSVEIRGTAELVDDPDKALPVRLSHKYLGIDPPNESADEQRVTIRVTRDKVITFSA